MKPLVSITVPVYNAEKYLSRCIESLINQTLQNIEIILVNDGSTDYSGEICNIYAKKDNRIKVFHKKNGGSASARQLGLDKSTGIYYTVCDSDDWVESNMYEELYNKAKRDNVDIVLSGLYTDYSDGRQLKQLPKEFVSQEKYIEDIMLHRENTNTVCKLFRLDTIKKYDINYEEGINLGEDALFLYKHLLHPMKIIVQNEAYYHYQRICGSNTYTNNVTMKSYLNNEYIYNWRLKNFPRFRKANLVGLIGLVFTAIRVNDMSNIFFKTKIAPQIKINQIIKYRLFSLKAILVIIAKSFGYKCAKRLYDISSNFFYK